MAFLIPAVVALVADVFLLWLNRLGPRGNDDFSNEEEHFVYHVRYLIPLAVIRIFLLCLPLLFHSYTGTAVQCPSFYQVLYWGTLLLVLAHMMALCLINPNSLQSFLPVMTTATTTATTTTMNVIHFRRILLEHLHELRRIWWILLSSLVSDVCHLIIYWHVKSTAPYADYDYLWWSSSSSSAQKQTPQQQPSVYYALRTGSMSRLPVNAGDGGGGGSGSGTVNDNYYNFMSTHNHHDGDDVNDNVDVDNDLVHAMNDLFADVRIRIQRAKTEWAARLEDFTTRHLPDRNNSINNNNTTSQHSRLNPSTSSVAGHASPPTPQPFLQSLSPFRVLLQLFAYEDVLQNGKLSAVFDMDDGAALTFYVPQLLSFLLHGALYCSPQLEEWILDRCRRNVYFAHRCFWFLRAWCLQNPTHPAAATTITSLNGTPQHSRQNSDSCSGAAAGLAPFLDTPSSPAHHLVDCGGGMVGGGGGLASAPSSGGLSAAAAMQFLPEERQMIQRLLQRVKECGEEAAQVLAFGGNNRTNSAGSAANNSRMSSPARPDRGNKSFVPSTPDSSELTDTAAVFFASSDEEDEIISRKEADVAFVDIVPEDARFPRTPTGLANATERGAIPKNPQDNSPSMSHFKVLSARRRYGFMPVEDTIMDNDAEDDDNDEESLLCLDSSAPSSSFASETEEFDKTPQFLDSLLLLADELFLIPRENRKKVLRQRLRALECDLLPSNSIYLPIGRVQHRVWRIVADESIALSTKERVPCIICLEVIDFAASTSPRRKRGGGWSQFLGRLPVPGYQRAQSLDAALIGSDDDAVVSSHYSVMESDHPTVDDTPSPLRHLQRPLSSPPGGGSPDRRHPAHRRSLSEAETIQQWRDAPRNPQRRTSLFTKVSTTVQNKVQDVQDHLNQYRERNLSEELQSLTLAESLANQADASSQSSPSETPADLEAQRQEDTSERMVPIVGSPPASGNLILSRASSGASLVSMGQWSSPNPLKKAKNERKRSQSHGESRKRENGGRHNVEGDRAIGALRYGSDTSENDEDTRSLSSSRNLRSPDALALSRNTRPTDSKPGKTPTRPPPVVFREDWKAKEERVRAQSAYGSHPGWRLLPVLVKGNDDLRQEQLASQLIYRMASILTREKVPVWLYNYEIIALTESGGLIEAIPDTISLDSLKKNDPKNTTLRSFFHSHFEPGEDLADAKANFVESLAAYSIVCFLLQIKDRHNGNILLDSRGHLIHIDFGFFFLSSPGKNAGFESAPFKLTRDFVELLDGPNSHLFRTFRELCVKTFLALRRHSMELILLVEMLKTGNERLNCFRGRPDDAIQQLRARFRLDLNDRACREYVNALVDDSIENWRTDWYDRYQRYFVGVL